jgi:UDP-N-acetylglucosamine 2-epimerase (non-hydrolysing)
MNRPKVFCVAGARPNFIKIKPVLDALEERDADAHLVHTGQHYDEAMNDVFFRDLNLRQPDHFLGAGSGSHAEQTARVMVAFEKLVADEAPDAVVVVGDVNSTLACSLVAAKAGSVVAHVEAGLRSRDWTMPEEVNRVVADRVSDLLFAPSPDAVRNLRAEGYAEDQIHLAGNVMIDSLYANLDRARESTVLSRYGLAPGGYGVVTLHRPSNVDNPDSLRALLGALGRVAADLPLVWPVHPRTAARLDAVGVPSGLRPVPPAGYLDFIALQAGARLVLTDSGGIQEETTALGVPCLTLRENTERPITVHEGTNRVVGVRPDDIVGAARDVLADPPPRRTPALWDGKAGARVAEALLAHLASAHTFRPTDERSVTTSAE